MANQSAKILLLEGIHPVAVKKLESEGFLVETESRALSGDELVERVQGFDGLGIRSKSQIDKSVLDRCPGLTAIGAFCIGTNQIDLDYANSMGLPVFNAPYSNTRSVAELVLAELIMLSRKLGDRNKDAHTGVWNKSAKGSNEIRGKILGIVGYGHIGSQLSIMAEFMGLKVIYYDVIKKLPLGNARPVETFQELLKESDFVSFHVPETPDTQGMMGRSQLDIMKKGSYLINASRGTVVDIPALAEKIESGHIAGAAVDVFPKEPASNNEEFVSELRGLPNVILTPHIGGSTEEAQAAIGSEVSESFINYFCKGETFGAVNFPSLEVPAISPEYARVLNVHKNVPGVLRDINKIVSDHDVNIARQFLSTDNYIGYLIMDMGRKEADQILSEISSLETSIRTEMISS